MHPDLIEHAAKYDTLSYMLNSNTVLLVPRNITDCQIL